MHPETRGDAGDAPGYNRLGLWPTIDCGLQLHHAVQQEMGESRMACWRCTSPMTTFILLANAAFVIWLLRVWVRSPPQFHAYRRSSIVMLSLWLIVVAFLAAMILRNRQQEIERVEIVSKASQRIGHA
jgi:cytochrome c biogenesis factor